jgi:hypothetical protein
LFIVEGDYPDAVIGLPFADVKEFGISNLFNVRTKYGSKLTS